MDQGLKVMTIIRKAKEEASDRGLYEVTDDILLYVLFKEVKEDVYGKILVDNCFSGYTLDGLMSKQYGYKNNDNFDKPTDVSISDETSNTIEKAEEFALRTNCDILDPGHLILALLETPRQCLQHYYNRHMINKHKITSEIVSMLFTGRTSWMPSLESKQTKQSKQAELPKVLSDTCEDLTEQARNDKIDPIIGRTEEINLMVETLARRTKNNVLLLGESGSGKTAIVKGLALKMANDEIPALSNKRILSLNIGALMGGTTYRGQLEQKMDDLIKALKKLENVILFIDEAHMLIGTGSSSENKTDIAQLLKPAMTDRSLQLILATTFKESKKIEADAAFMRRLNIVNIKQPNDEDTLAILKGLAYKYEDFHNVILPEETLKVAVRLSSKYITLRNQPDKAIDVIDDASARVKLDNTIPVINMVDRINEEIADIKYEIDNTVNFDTLTKLYKQLDEKNKELVAERKRQKENERPDPIVVTVDDIAKTIERRTGIPVSKLMKSDKEKLLHLEEELHKQVIGQDFAVKAVANAIRRNSAGISSSNKPIASFLFAGPSGVGKTELAKVLADSQFGTRDNIIRVDCSELSQEHSISKLIGAPAGYVGHGKGGGLTEQVKNKPYSVVLFDEVEKASQSFFDLLLQVLDEGKLTDAEGLTVSFRNCIIIMTTNLGSGLVETANKVGFGTVSNDKDESQYELLKERTMETIKKRLRPELINRIDDIVVFHSLNKDDQRQIARLLGKQLDARLLEQDIVVKCTDAALDFITDNGFNEAYGARPLARAIVKYIEEPLSIYMLEDKVLPGDKISIDLLDNELVFFKANGDELVLIDGEEVK